MHIKKMPDAFTEHGIYMLATVLKGSLAEQQSIFIVRRQACSWKFHKRISGNIKNSF